MCTVFSTPSSLEISASLAYYRYLTLPYRHNMSYTISVRTVDTTANDPGFTLVEKTLFYDETWSNIDSI
ncbi:hypothetical protein BDR03DRAFT_1046617 [Suillus americanus]|nr:hypothetical protein BDR03DRAFT_1046617 [Suillus americanus]